MTTKVGPEDKMYLFGYLDGLSFFLKRNYLYNLSMRIRRHSCDIIFVSSCKSYTYLQMDFNKPEVLFQNKKNPKVHYKQ